MPEYRSPSEYDSPSKQLASDDQNSSDQAQESPTVTKNASPMKKSNGTQQLFSEPPLTSAKSLPPTSSSQADEASPMLTFGQQLQL